MDKSAVRDAATIIVLRDATKNPSVLMGQRGSSAAFMPGKFVFPGGAVDPVDATVPITALSNIDDTQLREDSNLAPTTLAAAAIRELWEETGQILGTPASWKDAPKGWRGFARSDHHPNGSALQFFFRAITPPGRPRRFDARFFLTDVATLVTDPDDFSRAEDELAHLQWVPLMDARSFDLPFITRVVLAELTAQIASGVRPKNVPFFRNNDEARLVSRLGDRSLF
ncbi:8-oxo-dGTP pyrophosphatase MutT (NUDIX family) [Yoonia maritima]|uniref:8-oxo-dGTP pyrophosphatase MutT (NUDIX family) n=1 Tax=Yoonia maritima TaxID=1435347 RepID=A0A2T0W389_9RHOB|nr:NUDIX domain-containing protein [Yoonia maritima]PRY79652.1 8-oxo-dGTP pyrophosphatase MutT (NUDIX family) [Yoonia maritima]